MEIFSINQNKIGKQFEPSRELVGKTKEQVVETPEHIEKTKVQL